jgi:hypothetical protein
MLKRSIFLIGTQAILATALLFLVSSCGKDKSSSTGWNYNDSKWGGYEAHEYDGQETGPGLV